MRKVIIRVTSEPSLECWCPTCGAKFNEKNWYTDICGHCGQELDWTHVKVIEKNDGLDGEGVEHGF